MEPPKGQLVFTNNNQAEIIIHTEYIIKYKQLTTLNNLVFNSSDFIQLDLINFILNVHTGKGTIVSTEFVPHNTVEAGCDIFLDYKNIGSPLRH